MIICYCPDVFGSPYFRQCFFRTRRTVLELCPNIQSLRCIPPSAAYFAYFAASFQRVLLTVISRCFRGIVPGRFEVFGDLLASDGIALLAGILLLIGR